MCGDADVSLCNHWALGGAGAADLAQKVAAVCAAANKANFRFLYPLELSIKEKIEMIATKIYRAGSVQYSEEAEKKIARYTEQVGVVPLPPPSPPPFFFSFASLIHWLFPALALALFGAGIFGVAHLHGQNAFVLLD